MRETNMSFSKFCVEIFTLHIKVKCNIYKVLVFDYFQKSLLPNTFFKIKISNKHIKNI